MKPQPESAQPESAQPVRPFTHGASAYANGRCDCDICRAANTARQAGTRERRFARRILIDGRWFATTDDAGNLLPHGRASTYNNYGCRCTPCTNDNAAVCAANRARARERDRAKVARERERAKSVTPQM